MLSDSNPTPSWVSTGASIDFIEGFCKAEFLSGFKVSFHRA